MWRFNASAARTEVVGAKHSPLQGVVSTDGLNRDAQNRSVIAAQGPEAFGMPEMFTPMQHINANRALRKWRRDRDGRYSGVSYGAAVGHIVPEAARGGDIGRLKTGDLLHLRFRARRIDLLDPTAFRTACPVASWDLLGSRDRISPNAWRGIRASGNAGTPPPTG